MKTSMTTIAAAATLAATFFMAQNLPAAAADSVYELDIARAMSLPAATEALDGSVKFYFGDAAHPSVLRRFREYKTNQKTSALGRSHEAECTRVLMSALARFQRRAHDLGANAVINIHSYYKREDVSSETRIPCHTGFLIAGIALKGDFVRLSGK